jgi:hypothetical protein
MSSFVIFLLVFTSQFPEDEVVPIPILLQLQSSIADAPNASGIQIRQWVTKLLSRSIIIGSLAEGISFQ